MEFIVELRNIFKRYGDHVALADLSLGVRQGEFLTLLGASGSGKTTILRLVAGFEQPQSGQVLINDQDASDLPPYRRNVNTVFQHYALFPHLNVFRNVAFGLERSKRSKGEIESRVRSMLELVELPGKQERFPHELSGGEKQRVALARALVLNPAVLLLDEPLGALDQKLRRQMQLELRQLRERLGITFIFVTHDQEEALVMSDRIAVIQGGRLEQVGPGEEIYERPRTRFVAEFMGVENFFEVTSVGCSDDGTHFQTRSGLSLVAKDSRGLREGSGATLAVRPESIRLSVAPARAKPANLLAGRLVETIYEGGSRRCVVQLAGGERLLLRERAAADAPGPERMALGTPVWISWAAEKSLIFPRESAS